MDGKPNTDDDDDDAGSVQTVSLLLSLVFVRSINSSNKQTVQFP